MVAMFGRTRSEGGLDARIADFRAACEGRSAGERRQPPPEKPAAPDPPEAGALSSEDGLARARDELTARLTAEIRPERRALLSRGDLVNMVEAAVQGYWVRHPIDAGAQTRRDSSPILWSGWRHPATAKRDERAPGRRRGG